MWIRSFWLTTELVVTAVSIASIIGIPAGLAAAATGRSAGRRHPLLLFWLASIVASLTLPLVMHAAAWEATAGKFGWLTLTQSGSRSFGHFAGLIACGWIHGVHGSAILAWATWDGLTRVPGELNRASRMDAGPLRRTLSVRIPLAMPWVGVGMLAVGALAVTEMVVVDLYGLRTIADEFYLFHVAGPSPTAIAWVCGLPTLMAILLSWWTHRLTAKESIWIRSRPGKSGDASWIDRVDQRLGLDEGVAGARRWGWRWVRVTVLVLFSLLLVAVPLTSLLVKAGHQVEVVGTERTVRWSSTQCLEQLAAAPVTYRDEYLWTCLIGVGVATVAVLVGAVMAMRARDHRPIRTAMDCVTIAAFLLPGPVAGLIVVRLFQLPFPMAQTLYQQTIVPSGLALLFRALPVAYWVIRVGVLSVADPVWQSARLDHSLWGAFWKIVRPATPGVLLTAWIAAAVVASGDVPATLPVIPPGVTTVGTRLFALLHSGARYQEASLAFWYVAAVTVAILAASSRIRRS